MPENSLKQTKRQAPRTAFKPGQSGNPGGRPAVLKEIKELARQHTEDAVRALVEALQRPGERVRAAEILLAYGYGRPSQVMTVGVGMTLEALVMASMSIEGHASEVAIAGE